MKILIIVPKYTHNNLSLKPNYHYTLPLGMGYVISVLKKANHEVDCLNLNHLEGTVEDLVYLALDKKKYDLACSGHYGVGFLIIEKIIQSIRKHPSNPKIVIGGPLITSEPNIMTKNLDYDFGIIGEGEETILELINCLEKNKDPSEVPGLCFKKDNNTKITLSRKVIQDLDSLPYPDFKEMGFREQLEHMCSTDALYSALDYPKVYQIIGSRGCPFHCTFCYHTTGDKYRCRSVDNIIEEIKFAIKTYKINGFNLHDDLFSADKERLYDFCSKVKETIKPLPYKFKWRCSLWVGTVDREMLKTLKESGCYCVGFGFESYSKEVLKSMKKPITPRQIDNVIKLCFEMKMPIEGNFIFGDRAETLKTARETLNYWKKNCKGQVQLHFIHPYPGSEIYIHSIKKGLIKDKLDFIKNKMHHTFFLNMTDNMTNNEFEQLKKEVYNLKARYWKFVIPFKMKKNLEDNYDLHIKCPYCNQISIYKNNFIQNKYYFTIYTACRNSECQMRFYIVSKLYKFTAKNYLALDILRRNYLFIRDSLMKKRL